MEISDFVEEMPTPIHDFLVKNSKSHTIRCYMPGHKGMENPLDITEIDGADSLYDTDTNGGKGIIAQSEKNASRLFGSKRTLYSCSGSTLAIQTMLTLAKLRGNGKDHIIAGRYSHHSFINSCVLLGLTPSWVYPEDYLSAAVTPESIEAKINSRTLAVFINSIDYYGGMSDISAIAEVCHSHCIPLLVDNAHGAYLKFAPVDLHPMTLGADMCADSAHKTLPVLTGGAYLHIANEKYCAIAKEAMALTATSSPSYLILDSLDRCNRTIADKPFHIAEICNKITALKQHCADIGYILSPSDYMRITFDCAAVHSTGFAMADMLRAPENDEGEVTLVKASKKDGAYSEHSKIDICKKPAVPSDTYQDPYRLLAVKSILFRKGETSRYDVGGQDLRHGGGSLPSGNTADNAGRNDNDRCGKDAP